MRCFASACRCHRCMHHRDRSSTILRYRGLRFQVLRMELRSMNASLRMLFPTLHCFLSLLQYHCRPNSPRVLVHLPRSHRSCHHLHLPSLLSPCWIPSICRCHCKYACILHCLVNLLVSASPSLRTQLVELEVAFLSSPYNDSKVLHFLRFAWSLVFHVFCQRYFCHHKETRKLLPRI